MYAPPEHLWEDSMENSDRGVLALTNSSWRPSERKRTWSLRSLLDVVGWFSRALQQHTSWLYMVVISPMHILAELMFYSQMDHEINQESKKAVEGDVIPVEKRFETKNR